LGLNRLLDFAQLAFEIGNLLSGAPLKSRIVPTTKSTT